MRLFGERLGVELAPLRVPLEEGGRLQLDGASGTPPVLVEAWGARGSCEGSQKGESDDGCHEGAPGGPDARYEPEAGPAAYRSRSGGTLHWPKLDGAGAS